MKVVQARTMECSINKQFQKRFTFPFLRLSPFASPTVRSLCALLAFMVSSALCVLRSLSFTVHKVLSVRSLSVHVPFIQRPTFTQRSVSIVIGFSKAGRSISRTWNETFVERYMYSCFILKTWLLPKRTTKNL